MERGNGNGVHHAGEVQSAVKSVGDSASALSTEFRNFVADIEDLVKTSASLTGEELAAAKGKIKERIGAAKSMLGETSGTVMARARRTVAATNDYVYEEPWKAIGVGAAFGFLAGILVARR